ncbi:MAG: hypothetical protein ACXU9D_03920 [Xanthobacteraceae bacterium]
MPAKSGGADQPLTVVDLALEVLGITILEITVVDGMSCDPPSARSTDCSSSGGNESGRMRCEGSVRTSSGMTSVPSSRFGNESGVSCVSRRGFGAISLS